MVNIDKKHVYLMWVLGICLPALAFSVSQEETQRLILQLRSIVPDKVNSALHEVKRMGPKIPPVLLVEVVRLIIHPNERVYGVAAEIIHRLPESTQIQLVKGMVVEFHEKTGTEGGLDAGMLRLYTVLRNVPPKIVGTVLQELLRHREFFVSPMGVGVMEHVGHAFVNPLKNLLKNGNRRERLMAAMGLREMPDSVKRQDQELLTLLDVLGNIIDIETGQMDVFMFEDLARHRKLSPFVIPSLMDMVRSPEYADSIRKRGIAILLSWGVDVPTSIHDRLLKVTDEIKCP